MASSFISSFTSGTTLFLFCLLRRIFDRLDSRLRGNDETLRSRSMNKEFLAHLCTAIHATTQRPFEVRDATPVGGYARQAEQMMQKLLVEVG
ncbi:MAG: hypothetical protein HY937_05725 [Nitrosomonadales bacterium]|nr:hypothetical protein [Nitrosomonadales bacterium]